MSMPETPQERQIARDEETSVESAGGAEASTEAAIVDVAAIPAEVARLQAELRPILRQMWAVLGAPVEPVSPKGVWAIGHWTYGFKLSRVFDDELEARRAADDWERVVFLPFGASVVEVTC